MAEDTKDDGPDKRDLAVDHLEDSGPPPGDPTGVETTAARSSGGYEVGYGRPPKRTQFKPGQSGNPRGRPRKTVAGRINARAMLAEKLRTTRRATENGAEVMRELLDITIEQHLVGFAKGKIKSLKQVYELVDWIDRFESEQNAASSEAVDYAAEVRAKLTEMHERMKAREREDEERAKRGLPPLH